MLDELELEFLTTLADTCAQALDRVDALAEARAAATRLSFLAEASAELATHLDHRATLAKVARPAVPALAGWCAVDIFEDGRLHTLAVAHVDPDKVTLAHELQRRYPRSIGRARPWTRRPGDPRTTAARARLTSRTTRGFATFLTQLGWQDQSPTAPINL